MSSFFAGFAPLLAIAGVVMSLLVLLRTRRLAVALPVLLDFLLAAGLLRLSASQTWTAIGSAAAIIIIRKVVTLGLKTGRAARARPTAQA